MRMTETKITDPRDKLRGRSNVKDSQELIDFYHKLEKNLQQLSGEERMK